MGRPADVTAAHPARISFTVPVGFTQPVPPLPGALGVDRDRAGVVVVRTRDLPQTLAALLAWAAAHDVTLTDLDARPASLEEAFLAVAQSAAGRSALAQSDEPSPRGPSSTGPSSTAPSSTTEVAR
jgi:ABC-2 type transport system ATP-binding protein